MTLENLKLKRSGAAPLMRLEKVEKISVLESPGLADRTSENVDSSDE
jgi:hypothetical protein